VPALVLTFRGNRPSSERTLQLGAARMISKEAHVGEIFDAIGELGGLGDY
jgi:DNA-binding NarL/FixJ family response regulator